MRRPLWMLIVKKISSDGGTARLLIPLIRKEDFAKRPRI